jgi:hypothetical protein
MIIREGCNSILVSTQTNISIGKRKARTSEILAIAGMTLLVIDIADTFIAQGGYGFLQLTDQQRGPLVGIPSMVLFFISFGIGYNQRSRLATTLLLTGGILELAFKLIAPMTGLLLPLAIGQTPLYIALIAISCVIIGLGLFRAVKGL